jgi:hypothetical protein
MRKLALAIAFFVGLSAPAAAQKADIEAVNAKWVEFFNKGDFEGVASLYTADAAAFPPGAQSGDWRDVEGHGGAGQRSESHDAGRQAIGSFRGA